MSYHVYRISDGELISSTTVLPSLTAEFDYVQFADGYEDGKIWNPSTLDFDIRPPARIIGKTDFIERFTTAEVKELFGFTIGSTYNENQQKNISSLMRYLDFLDEVNLDNTRINTGVNYLENVGILAAGRAAEILT